jgi:hypothetical protein
MVLLFFIGSATVKAQNEKFKALFLYNFIKNIEWPASYKQGDVIIGVLGNSSIVKDLETITATQKSGNQSMKVIVFDNVDQITNCHLIYVSPGKGSLLSGLLTKLNGSSTLVITDTKNGIQQGSGINFILDGDKLKFEIFKKRIEQKGLKVSTALLTFGIQVND